MDANPPRPRCNARRVGLALYALLVPLVWAVHWYPIRFGALRALLVVGVATLWLGALWLIWPRRALRAVLAAASLLGFAFMLLPGAPVAPAALRGAYVRALASYEGTPYVWGGESHRGIDCSGLVRCALIDANFHEGIAKRNPAAIRAAFSLWWNDSSAKALRDEYQGRTRKLFAARSINEAPSSRLQPGDLAVTANGLHVLAYLGDGTWIEADPSELHGDRVLKVQVPTQNSWFSMPVQIMRWRELEG